MDFDKELDARGLSCLLPILKTKKSLDELADRAGAAARRSRHTLAAPSSLSMPTHLSRAT